MEEIPERGVRGGLRQHQKERERVGGEAADTGDKGVK